MCLCVCVGGGGYFFPSPPASSSPLFLVPLSISPSLSLSFSLSLSRFPRSYLTLWLLSPQTLQSDGISVRSGSIPVCLNEVDLEESREIVMKKVAA